MSLILCSHMRKPIGSLGLLNEDSHAFGEPPLNNVKRLEDRIVPVEVFCIRNAIYFPF